MKDKKNNFLTSVLLITAATTLFIVILSTSTNVITQASGFPIFFVSGNEYGSRYTTIPPIPGWVPALPSGQPPAPPGPSPSLIPTPGAGAVSEVVQREIIQQYLSQFAPAISITNVQVDPPEIDPLDLFADKFAIAVTVKNTGNAPLANVYARIVNSAIDSLTAFIPTGDIFESYVYDYKSRKTVLQKLCSLRPNLYDFKIGDCQMGILPAQQEKTINFRFELSGADYSQICTGADTGLVPFSIIVGGQTPPQQPIQSELTIVNLQIICP